MRKNILTTLIAILLPLFVCPQTYKYIGMEDGLSNRQVYAIEKDRKGYMWFLTPEGIDRYNGKEFKHYKLMDGEQELNSAINLNWLYLDTDGVLWERRAASSATKASTTVSNWCTSFPNRQKRNTIRP